ncbi:MAG TPA: F0F1 ATP synthase subunit A [Cytophagaceae bacterium]
MEKLLKKYTILTLIAYLVFAFPALASSEENGKKFNPGELISHHIADSHEWHFFSIGESHYSIPLPVIVYSKEYGLEIFSSSKFHNPTHTYKGYKLDHEHIYAVNDAGHVLEDVKIYDFSITKNVASLLLSAVILILVFTAVSRGYKKNKGHAPKGIQSFFEPIIVFVRDDIAKSIIGPKYEKYLPYLLTVFFFIWFNNLLGLIPGGANLTGNIAVTMVLALITFVITNFSGNKYYWKHIFWTPGIPVPIKLLIVPVEIVGMFTKPFSLMVRLFANITAGHIIILSLLGLIFIFEHAAASLISLPFVLFMSFLELFVAVLQAYIFTLLSAMYIGSAIEEHSHADHDHGH